MPGPLVVVIFVATADVGTPSTTALVSATRDALGGATVMIEPVSVLPTDEEAIRAGEDVHADAVAEVTWTLPSRDKAHLHVCAAKKCSDRDLLFGPADDATQRGRAVGLAIATMVPPTPAPAPTPTPTPTPTPAPAPTPTPTPTPAPAPAPPPAPAPAPTPAPARLRFEVDAAFAAAWGASGVGYEAATRLHSSRGWYVDAGLGARFGRIPEAAIDATTVRLSLGLGLDVIESGHFTASLSVDALALRHDLHRKYGSELVEHARWIGGFDVLATGSYAFSEPLAMFLSAGLELGFGETTVLVGDSAVATIPRVRGLFLSGVRLRF